MNDTFRRQYAPLTDEQKKQADDIKAKAEELLALFNQAVPTEERSERSRLMSVARTNLEDSIMWAAKAVFTKQA